MEDGVTRANAGPTHNKRMDLGARLCLCSWICIHVGVVLSNMFAFPLFLKLFRSSCSSESKGAVTHLFLTKRMATSTSSMKTSTPALIPAIFTTLSVCLAGSGMTSGSSVAPKT